MMRGTEATDRTVERPTRTRRRLVLLALAAVAALVAWPSASRWLRSERTVDRERLRLADIVRGDLERDIALNGRTVAAFHPTFFSPARGIVHVAARPGETVTRGQVLLRVESPELESRLARERAASEASQSELERRRIAARAAELRNVQEQDRLAIKAEAAERAMVRAQKIFDEGLTNTIEYERAQDDVKLSRLALDHARQQSVLDRERSSFEVRQAELDFERQNLLVEDFERQVAALDVRTTVSGQVSRLDVEDRDAVVQGQALGAVVDLSTFEVEVGVPQSYAAELVVGTHAEVRLQGGGKVYQARVRRVAPEVEKNVVEARLELLDVLPETSGQSSLKQGQTTSVRIVFEARRDVLTLRRGPFLETDGGRFAYVLSSDGLARRRPIELGARSVAVVEIVSGLEEGDTVVISETSSFAGADTVLVR